MTKIKYISTILLTSILGCGLSPVSSAHDMQGQPDLSGVWMAFASSPRFVRGDPSPLTATGEEMVNSYYARYGDDYVEPGAYCVPPGMPSTMTSIVGYPIEILQTRDRVTMLAEMEMQVRRVYMDGRQHPDNYPATRMGYSIGHWDGNALVIETALLSESLLRGWPRTGQTRISEKLYLAKRSGVDAEPSRFITLEPEGNDVLVVELAVTDPVLYNAERKVTVYYQRIRDDATLEYDCPAEHWLKALEAAGETDI